MIAGGYSCLFGTSIIPPLDALCKQVYNITTMVNNGEKKKLHRLTITFPDSLYQIFKQRAKENNRSLSGEINHFLQFHLDTVGAHSSGLRGPVHSMADETWLSFKTQKMVKKNDS